QQHLDRGEDACRQLPTDRHFPKRGEDGAESREDEIVLEPGTVGLPSRGKHDQDEDPADESDVADALPGRKRANDFSDIAGVERLADEFRPQRRPDGADLRGHAALSFSTASSSTRSAKSMAWMRPCRAAKAGLPGAPMLSALSSALTWPGCGERTRMRLPTVIASSIEWVTKRTGDRTPSQSCSNSSCILRPAPAL